MAKDSSLHCKMDGRVFQMRDGSSHRPIPFSSAKHNYTKGDMDRLKVGQSVSFMPMFGNANPVYSSLVRIR
ncbi:MAG: hypothetical protein K0R00_67 [Herbinix sp.]|jgi:hypothetical protein|nr:hypothetical protein [Herbinix sp.]